MSEHEIENSIRIGLYYDSTVLNKITIKSKTKMYLGNVINEKFETKKEIDTGSTLVLEIDSVSNNYMKIWIDGKLVDGLEGVVQVIPEYNQNGEQRITVNN